MSGRWDKERNCSDCWYWELRHQSALLSPPLQQGGENNDDNWWICLLLYLMEKLLSMMLWEIGLLPNWLQSHWAGSPWRSPRPAPASSSPGRPGRTVSPDHHNDDGDVKLTSTLSMMMMKTSSVGKLPLPWMGTTSFISSLNRDTLKSSYVLYCCRLMLTMMKWVIMFFRIMTMIMRIKPVHMIGLRTSGPAKERECLVFYYWDKSKFTIQTNQVYKFIICMFLSNKK